MSDAEMARRYLEIRSAWPLDVAPEGRAYLIGSDAPGTAQVFRLGAREAPPPRAPEEMVQITDLAEPAFALYLPADPSGSGRSRVLVMTDQGGDERHQLFVAGDDPPAPLRETRELEALVVDPTSIHRPGGISRDGAALAFSSNRRDGVAFDTWILEFASGREEVAFGSGGWTEPCGFSPEGRYLAITEITTRAGDNRLYLVDRHALEGAPAAPGARAVREIAPHDEDPATVGAPCWCPDETTFFFATNVGREYSGIARGRPEDAWEYVIEPGWDAQCHLDWAGRYLLVAWNEAGMSRAELRDPQSLERVAPVPLPGEGVATGYRLSRDGNELLFGFSAADRPAEAWRYDIEGGALDQLTRSPCELDRARFAPAELVHFGSHDGLTIPAFLLRPLRSEGPAPVIVVIHGGPESQWRPSFSPVVQLLVDQGFAVIAPNVRGSTGYGRRYRALDDKERRFDAIRDLEALHDYLAGHPDLDEERAILYGGSYGGYLTLCGLAFQPERWAGGVDLVGMSSLVSFLENTSAWRRPFREREYGSLGPDRDLLEALSPIHRVEAIRAPLFIVHGANDPRVPLGEAEQIHRVLRGRGLRCELEVYADEGHGLAKLKNRLEVYPRIAAFVREVAGL